MFAQMKLEPIGTERLCTIQSPDVSPFISDEHRNQV